MKKIAILDYGSGNIFSIKQALNKIGVVSNLESQPDNLKYYDGIILPGVGSFKSAIREIKVKGFDSAIWEHIDKGKYLLGICLGMQLLLESSDEFGHSIGLGIIKGNVSRFSDLEKGFKIPQIQWNKVITQDINSKLFYRIPSNPFMYFLHSYYVSIRDSRVQIINTNYGGKNYNSVFEFENVFGVQFHPEKSASNGLNVLENFCKII